MGSWSSGIVNVTMIPKIMFMVIIMIIENEEKKRKEEKLGRFFKRERF
jgi:hypothetical protein